MSVKLTVPRNQLCGSLLSPPESPDMSSLPTKSTDIQAQSTLSTASPPAAIGRLDRPAIPTLGVGWPRRTVSFSRSQYNINSQTSSSFPNIQPSVSSYPAESLVATDYSYENLSSNEPQGKLEGRVGYSPFVAPIATSHPSSSVHNPARGPSTYRENHERDENDGLVSAASEDDEDNAIQGAAMSVAQRRAERRRMKRFRFEP